jgi:hypothetical protein
MTRKILGRNPTPLSGESLNGYLLRIAKVNGLVCIYELLEAIEMSKPKRRCYGIWNKEEIERLNQVLSISLRRPFDAYTLPCQQSHKWIYKEYRILRDLRVDFPRICPVCMANNEPIDWRWGLGTVARCEKHDHLLLDACPSCRAPYKWKSDIYKGCTHCDISWSNLLEHHVSEYFELSPLEKALYPNNEGDLSSSIDMINDLCRAIVIMARPYDQLSQSFRRIPYSKNHSSLVIQAFKFLQNEEFKEKWREEFDAIHSFTQKSPDSGILLKERLEYVRASRLKYFNEKETHLLRYHVNNVQLASALGASTKDIFQLVKIADFPQLNETGFVKSKLFDLQKVLVFLDNYQSTESINRIKICSNDKCFGKYLTSYGALLAHLFSGELSGCMFNLQKLSSILVCKEELYIWLTKQLFEACAKPVAISNVARLLGKTSEYVKALVKSRKLHYAAWQRNRDMIDGQSLLSYLNVV